LSPKGDKFLSASFVGSCKPFCDHPPFFWVRCGHWPTAHVTQKPAFQKVGSLLSAAHFPPWARHTRLIPRSYPLLTRTMFSWSGYGADMEGIWSGYTTGGKGGGAVERVLRHEKSSGGSALSHTGSDTGSMGWAESLFENSTSRPLVAADVRKRRVWTDFTGRSRLKTKTASSRRPLQRW
jgi:hypothetical protein